MRNEVDKYSLYDLSRMAGCSQPEGEDTDGAKFLRECISMAMEIDNYYDEVGSDEIAETADGLVPIYTNELWNVWVDCGGYRHDGEFRDFARSNDVGDMMNRIAQADCYEWAYNILGSYARDME